MSTTTNPMATAASREQLVAHFAARLHAETDPSDVYAAQKAALAFAQLGYSVREMIGGFEYWAREGYPVENAMGRVAFPKDPTVGLVRD